MSACRSVSKLFDTLMVFLIIFFLKKLTLKEKKILIFALKHRLWVLVRMYPQLNKKNITIFSYENYNFYSHEKSQHIIA